MSSLLNFYSIIHCAATTQIHLFNISWPQRSASVMSSPRKLLLWLQSPQIRFLKTLWMEFYPSHVFFAYDFLSSTLPLWNPSGYHVTIVCFFQLLYKNLLSDLLQVILLLVDILVVFSLELLQIKLLWTSLNLPFSTHVCTFKWV